MHTFTLPLSDPILIFMIILLVVLLIPVFLRKTKIPPIVGLIIVGIIIGPHAANIIDDNDTIELFSRVGLLYIMFLAGLELEFIEFRKNRGKAFFFGIASFSFPFALGYGAAISIFSMDQIPAILIGIMLASNTLIAYPVVSKLGIGKTPAITTAISGTVIADTIVLAVLAFVTTLVSGSEGNGFFLSFVLSFGIFIFAIFYLLPKLGRWFFKSLANDGDLQFLFTLSALFAASLGAELAGAEPIIGAFFAGLALNKLIPPSSALMNRISFVGNTLFVPFFLISVGMLVNLKILFSGYQSIIYAIILISIAISSKWIAAWLTAKVFRQSKNEMNTIFGLTTARAAATLAIVLVGLKYDLLNNDLFNGTILLILVTSLYSSYKTEKSGFKLAIEENTKLPEPSLPIENRILVPIANPKNIEKLIDLAMLLHVPKTKEPIYTLAIVKDDAEARQKVLSNKKIIDSIIHQAAASEIFVHGITRIEINIATAIARTSKELHISDIVIGWSGKAPKEINRVFGNMLETILDNTDSSVIVSQLTQPCNTTDRLVIFVPAYAEKEYGFSHWINMIIHLCKQLSSALTFYLVPETLTAIEKTFGGKLKGISLKYVETTDTPDLESIRRSDEQHLYIFINSRKQTLSFNPWLYKLTYRMPEAMKTQNVLNVYPIQNKDAIS